MVARAINTDGESVTNEATKEVVPWRRCSMIATIAASAFEASGKD
jgi:hypothetical protein